MELPPDFHAKSKIGQVELAKLHVDRAYQRDLSMRLVDEIAANWDEVASELVMLADRGERNEEETGVKGGLFIVNGQHRTAAARKLQLPKIWARVIDLSETKDPAALEAELRLKTNVRMADRPLERFKAQLRAGDERSKRIVEILGRFDTEINETPVADMGINAVTVVETIYDVDDGGLLVETLEVLRDAYKVVQGKHASGALMKAAAWFIYKHAEEADRKRFIPRTSEAGIAALGRRARTIQSTMGGTLWLNYYRTLVDFYNERLTEKSKLKWNTTGSAGFQVRRGYAAKDLTKVGVKGRGGNW